jgi:AAA+ ATPase superfamily predicted ATPase
MFSNRQNEIDLLHAMYASKRAPLLTLYGRRHLGKTERLRAFSDGCHHLLFIVALRRIYNLPHSPHKVAAFTHAIPSAVFSSLFPIYALRRLD